MYLLGQITNVIIPFPKDFSYASAYLALVLSFSGIFGSLAILLSTVNKNIPDSTKLLLCVTFADLLLGTCISVYIFQNIKSDGFAWGKLGCTWNYYILHFSFFASIFTIVAIALERYFAVCKERSFSAKTINQCIIAIIMGGLIFCYIPFIAGQQDIAIQLENINSHCVLTWTGRAPISLFMNTATVLILIVSNFIIHFCYTSVYKKFKSIQLL
jgi:hypothetical protein